MSPRSPEAVAAFAAFRATQRDLLEGLRACSSGQELMERGFAADVQLAASTGASACIPVLAGTAFVACLS